MGMPLVLVQLSKTAEIRATYNPNKLRHMLIKAVPQKPEPSYPKDGDVKTMNKTKTAAGEHRDM